jgi:hypothetical protein
MPNVFELIAGAPLLWTSTAVSFATWGLLLWIAWPWLAEGGFRRIFTVLAGVHLFRWIGLVALNPAHVDGQALGLEHAYLQQVAYGDLAANVLAIVAIIAVRSQWTSQLFWAWAFIVVGTADTLNAGPNFIMAIKDDAQVGALGWLILVGYVPAILLTEIVLIVQLVRRSVIGTNHKAVAA